MIVVTFTDGAALSLWYIVAFAVEGAALCRETHRHTALAAAEMAGVHPEHLAIAILHSTEDTCRLSLCKNIITGFRHLVMGEHADCASTKYKGLNIHSQGIRNYIFYDSLIKHELTLFLQFFKKLELYLPQFCHNE